jgi:chromosome segregation ATPase
MNPRTALILAGIALVVGVVGLVIGISAKNGNSSDKHISEVAQQQLEQQLGNTANAVKGQVAAQGAKATATAASIDKQLRDLRSSTNAIQNSINTLNTTTATQATDIKNLQNQVDKLDTRVSNLGG